jgi:hypothetical protein
MERQQESLTRNSIDSEEGPQNASLKIREINVFQLESFSKICYDVNKNPLEVKNLV